MLYCYIHVDGFSAFLSIGRPAPPFATLSPQDVTKAKTYSRNMQIVSGWVIIPDHLIRHELVVSSLNLGVDLPNLFFYIPLCPKCTTRGEQHLLGCVINM
jgi:hypothetical protein